MSDRLRLLGDAALLPAWRKAICHLVRLQTAKRTEGRLAVGACDVRSVERDDVHVGIESQVARAALDDVQQPPRAVVTWRQPGSRQRLLPNRSATVHPLGEVRPFLRSFGYLDPRRPLA